MIERRPHWTDDLIDAVFRALSHTYRAQGWTGGIAIDLDESVYPLIAAVEDWHKAKRDSRIRTHSEGCWRWHNECAEGLIVSQQAAIQRVRELHREHVCDWASAPFACFIVHGGECAHRGKCRICHAEKCDTIRALDGDA